MQKTFLKEARLVLCEDNCTYGTQYAVVGHNGGNEGSFKPILDSKLVNIYLGPCLLDQMHLIATLKELDTLGSSWQAKFMLLTSPVIYRYTLLDGQRFIHVTSGEGVDKALLFQIGHAGPNWRKDFPESIFA